MKQIIVLSKKLISRQSGVPWVVTSAFIGSLFTFSELTFASCLGNRLTERHVTDLIGFPHMEERSMGMIPINIEVRTCFKVSGCSAWQSEVETRTPPSEAIDHILTDKDGFELPRRMFVIFFAQRDHAWVRLHINEHESIPFTPSQSGLDQTIVQGVRLLDTPIRMSIYHSEHCLEAVAVATRPVTTTEENTKWIEARLSSHLSF